LEAYPSTTKLRAMDILDLVEDHQAEDLANPRPGAQSVARMGVVLLRRLHDIEIQFAEEAIVIVEQSEVHLDTLAGGGIEKRLSHAGTIGFISNLLPNLGQIVLTVSALDVGQGSRPLSGEMHPAVEQVTGSPPLGGIDIGLGQHPTAQEESDLVRIELVVLGLAAVDGFHREGVTQDEGNALASAEVSEPVPGEEALATDNKSLPTGRHGFEEWCWSCLPMPVDQDLAVLAQDTDRHGARVSIDATVKFVLLVVESHEVSSSSVGCRPSASIPRRHAEEGASISINGMQATTSRVR
jgi:hypothetical protein